jgi:PAS domain S-box-containing protein
MRRRIVAVAVVLAGGIGVVSLAGWGANVDVLRGFAGQITTKANTAVGLIAAAAGLWLTAQGRRRSGFVLALGVGALGLATLAEHLFSLDLGIDQLLFTEAPGASGTTSPGRMGPNACVSFILAAAVLILLNTTSRRAFIAAQALAFAVGVLALTAMTGYFSGAQQLFAIARYTGIALQTAIAFFALSVGLLSVRPEVGPVAVFASERAGGLVLRRLVLPAVVLPLALAYGTLVGLRAGVFDAPLGIALLAVALVTLLGGAIWWTAYVLNALDRSRLEAQHAIVETEERFRTLANEAPVLIWVDEYGRRMWFNVRWVEFTGLSADALRNTWEALIHPDDARACQARRREAAERGTGYTIEYRLKRADAAFRWILETAAPRTAHDGGVVGLVGSSIDITDRKELEQQAIAAREAAESASRMKDDFLATLSHELRTPLNAILGYSRILRMSSLPESRRSHALDVIERNAVLQTALVEDILDLSRITAGKLRLEVERVDVATPLREAVESLRPSADAKDIQVLVTSDPHPATARGDAARLQQIFWNVLSNAIKFTPQGGHVHVRLWCESRHVTVQVTDDGTGIPREFLPYIFEPFRQADTGFARRYGGLGLGLSVCRRLVELHGGTIEAHSDGVGRGATFTIRLPCVVEPAIASVSSEAPVTVATRSASSITLHGLTVLVVDDELEARELLKDVLEAAGAIVLTASNADGALQTYQRHGADVLVTDLGMPVADGYELLRSIQAVDRGTGRSVPAIAVTAYARSEDRAKCLRAGFVAHISKPIDPMVIVDVVGRTARQLSADAGSELAEGSLG